MLEAFLIEFIIPIIVVSCKGYIDTILSTLFVPSSVVLQSKGYIKFTFIINSHSIVLRNKGYIDTIYIIRVVIGCSQEQRLYRDYFHHY